MHSKKSIQSAKLKLCNDLKLHIKELLFGNERVKPNRKASSPTFGSNPKLTC